MRNADTVNATGVPAAVSSASARRVDAEHAFGGEPVGDGRRANTETEHLIADGLNDGERHPQPGHHRDIRLSAAMAEFA